MFCHLHPSQWGSEATLSLFFHLRSWDPAEDTHKASPPSPEVFEREVNRPPLLSAVFLSSFLPLLPGVSFRLSKTRRKGSWPVGDRCSFPALCSWPVLFKHPALGHMGWSQGSRILDPGYWGTQMSQLLLKGELTLWCLTTAQHLREKVSLQEEH